jgi:hypothetical protein
MLGAAPMKRVVVVGSVVVAFLAGCGGATADSASSPPKHDDPSSAIGTHDPQAGSPSAALSAICDGVAGLTGQSVLDALDVPTGGTFHRSSPEVESPTPLTLRIHYEGGSVECIAAHSDGSSMNPSVVAATVRVHVNVDFATGDGLLDEHFDGELVSEGQSVGFEAVVPVASLAGSYKSVADRDELGASVPVWFHATFLHGQKLGSYGFVGHGVNQDAFGYYDFK